MDKPRHLNQPYAKIVINKKQNVMSYFAIILAAIGMLTPMTGRIVMALIARRNPQSVWAGAERRQYVRRLLKVAAWVVTCVALLLMYLIDEGVIVQN